MVFMFFRFATLNRKTIPPFRSRLPRTSALSVLTLNLKSLQKTNIACKLLNMATVNLIKASLNGKLGELYGTKQYNKAYLKAIPFSHAPHNPAQINSYSAFQKLNRLASGLAKTCFDVFGVKDTKKLKHNIIASILKPIIKNKTFDIANLADIMPEDGATNILQFDVDRNLQKITVRANTTESVSDLHFFVVCVFDENGNVIYSENVNADYFQKEITTITAGHTFGVFAFHSDKKANKQILHGLSYRVETANLIVENHIMYVDRGWWAMRPYVQDHVLYLSLQDAETILHILHLDIVQGG